MKLQARQVKTKKLIDIAEKYLNRPYKYGAKMSEAPNFFDCSGFIKYVFDKIGIQLHRSTVEQAKFDGNRINGVKNLKPGDLIFIRGNRGHYSSDFPHGIGHALLHIGNGKVIHATSKRIQENPHIIEKGKVVIESLGPILRKEKYPPIIKRVL